MAAPTLDGNALGSVNSINYVKDANIIPIALAGSDSDDTLTFDLFGVTKIIRVEGLFAGETATVKAAIDVIAGLVAGAQTDSVNFISDELGTIGVKINSFDVTWVIPSNRATYVLTLTEGV